MMQIDKKHLDILLETFAMGAQAAWEWHVRKGEPIDHSPIIDIENEPEVGEAWDTLVELGFALVSENDNPQTRDTHPFVGRLTHLGMLWVFLYSHRIVVKAMKVPGTDETLAQVLDRVCQANLTKEGFHG